MIMTRTMPLRATAARRACRLSPIRRMRERRISSPSIWLDGKPGVNHKGAAGHCSPLFYRLIEAARSSIFGLGVGIGRCLGLFASNARLLQAFAGQEPLVGGTDGGRLVVIEEWQGRIA